MKKFDLRGISDDVVETIIEKEITFFDISMPKYLLANASVNLAITILLVNGCLGHKDWEQATTLAKKRMEQYIDDQAKEEPIC